MFLERLLVSIKIDRWIDLIESNIDEIDSFIYFDILILVTVLILVYLGFGVLRISRTISRLGYAERERERDRKKERESKVSIQPTNQLQKYYRQNHARNQQTEPHS